MSSHCSELTEEVCRQMAKTYKFEVDDHVFLKVMPERSVVRFNKRGKLLPRYIGPLEILKRVGTSVY